MKAIFINVAKATLLSTLTLTTLSACDNSEKSNLVPFVNIGSVISHTDILKQEKMHLDAVKSTLMASAKKVNEVYKTMPEDAKKKAAVVDAAILNRNWSVEERKARVVSTQAVINKVEEYRKKHHIPVVINRSAVLTADPKADISGEIVKSLSGTTVNYGSLPQIKLKPQDAIPPENK